MILQVWNLATKAKRTCEFAGGGLFSVPTNTVQQ